MQPQAPQASVECHTPPRLRRESRHGLAGRRLLGGLAVGLCALALNAAAQTAKPKLELEMTVQKEVRVERDGKEEVTLEPVATTEAGDVLVYTITYRNRGDEAATKAALVGPVPEGTIYVLDSAETEEEAAILFSIDGGTTYAEPPITYEVRKPDGTAERKPAPADMYTHVRWVLREPVPPGQSGHVTYKVRVK